MKEKFKKELFSWLQTFIFAIVIGLVIHNTITASALVISGSMENTIMTNSRVMGLRFVYLISDPERFDIILFHPPDSKSEMPYVKRIVGLPNEKVDIVDGKVYINDSVIPLDDSFSKGVPHGNFGPFNVPDNSYFVMGDNRNSSTDSRHWENSFISRSSIIAKLYFEIFPSPHMFR